MFASSDIRVGREKVGSEDLRAMWLRKFCLRLIAPSVSLSFSAVQFLTICSWASRASDAAEARGARVLRASETFVGKRICWRCSRERVGLAAFLAAAVAARARPARSMALANWGWLWK
eukprot:738689-Rhodomonas_salina.1